METAFKYLSGHGPKDAVPWNFTVTNGRRAGEKTTIPVPSNWDQHGFGTYDYGDSPVPKSDEHGLYSRKFTIPPEWKGRRIRLVFEGVMTDAEVKVNGRLAGPVHQGGFYRFRFDISRLLKEGEENLLEVDVSKISANAATERAERHGDYWVFGGIFRPVYLEAVPPQFIEQVSLDARADGAFNATVDLGNGGSRDADKLEVQILTATGEPVGEPFFAEIPGGGTGRLQVSSRMDHPRLWTAETPHLYQAKFRLMKGSEEIHTVTERFGFRTITVRKGEGIFLNGKRIVLKGVCRHSFRPETGRALDAEDSLEDIKLLKEMNMNAVRMSHYPPDVAFLEMCDELGLYVIDELSGWQAAHDTENGRKLVREMVTRDVNHPSILFWDNGNEGGWNRELDREFSLYDPQSRLVLHPWEVMNGIDTKHYPTFEDLSKRLGGSNIVMPTEMLHGMYDGGVGAGLEDYWKAISASPVGGGGFIWVLADEGIMRTDQNNQLDVFSTFAPDGIVGPHHEKEGSFYTVRDIFNPVQIDTPNIDETFDGSLTVHNRYDFLSTKDCRFEWKLLHYPGPSETSAKTEVISSGKANSPDIAAGTDGKLELELPESWRKADALSLVATDANGLELWTWNWPLPAFIKGKETGSNRTDASDSAEPRVGDQITLRSGKTTAKFDHRTGRLLNLMDGDAVAAFTNGPRVVFARPESGNESWTEAPDLDPGEQGEVLWNFEKARMLNLLDIEMQPAKGVNWAGFHLEISPDGKSWKTLYDATRRFSDGTRYEFPPQLVSAVKLSKFRQTDGKSGKLKRMRAAYQADRFPTTDEAEAKVTSGSDWLSVISADGTTRFQWTLSDIGELKLDYSYELEGNFIYHGITFDHPEAAFKSVKWLGDGPSRVWQNRLRGTTLGIYEIARNDIQPGESWGFPEFQGYFGGLRWARFETAAGMLTVTCDEPSTYLRIGTPRINFPRTTPSFPAGDLSFLKAIPAMGTKFSDPEGGGPASQPAKASGQQKGTLRFQFEG